MKFFLIICLNKREKAAPCEKFRNKHSPTLSCMKQTAERSHPVSGCRFSSWRGGILATESPRSLKRLARLPAPCCPRSTARPRGCEGLARWGQWPRA
eukprot:scaffold1090_cov265-Pinguiococcus_pyrenoidosus.AAC.17